MERTTQNKTLSKDEQIQYSDENYNKLDHIELYSKLTKLNEKLDEYKQEKIDAKKQKKKYFVESDDPSELSDEVSILSKESSEFTHQITQGKQILKG